MKPVSFDGCFGWLHQAGGGSRGVVLCEAWDYEALSVHQSWRVLAERLAEAGLPTLRFDYFGCGDSLGDSNAPGATEAKRASLRHAIRFLREAAGVSSVTLIGLRLGAAFALETAVEQSAVDRLVLVRPVVRGKLFLLEQKALANVVAAREGAGVVRESDDGRIEIEGFTLDREDIDVITKIDLRSIDKPPSPHILLVGEPAARHYDALGARLTELGAHVSKLELSEVTAWAPSAIPTPPPLVDIDSIVEWVREGSHSRHAHSVASGRIEADAFVETAVEFGDTEALRGILCRPGTKARAYERQAVLFLNAGANRHIGSGRTTVEHARHLAAQGVASLRMDSVGIGDSAWRIEGPLAVIHHNERAVDVSRAIDALERAGFDDVSVTGVCSGAFLAFRSALKDPRIKRLVLVNPQFWLPLSKEQLADPTQGTFGATSTYFRKIVSLRAWLRVLRGGADIDALMSVGREIAKRKGKLLLTRFSRRLARFSKHGDQRPELERELTALGERGCQTLLVFSGADPAREVFAAHMGALDMTRLPKGLTIETVEGADHVFAMRRTRGEFRRLLTRFVAGGTTLPGRGRERVDHDMNPNLGQHVFANEPGGSHTSGHDLPPAETTKERQWRATG